MGLRGQWGFGWGQRFSGFGPNAFAVTVLQRVLVVTGWLGLVWHVVHILTPMQHSLHGKVVTMTFSRFATSTASIIPSTSLVGSFRGFEELCAFASRLCRVVTITDDL